MLLNTNQNLIDKLVDTTVLKTPRIIEAIKNIDRADFVRKEDKDYAYHDTALPIGHNVTISQPTTVAIMLELLQPKRGDIILDLGSGSGWTSALMAYIVGGEGRVIGVEIIPELVKFSKKNLKKYSFKNIEILQAQTSILGLPGKAPFDKILVSAAAQKLPQKLINQLNPNGRLVIPIGNSVWKIDKNLDGTLSKQEIWGFAFVPLQ